MKKKWTLREGNKNDEAEVVDLLSSLMRQHFTYDSYYEPSENLEGAFKDEFYRVLNKDDGLVLVAEDSGKLVGILTLEILSKPSFFKKQKYGYVIAGIIAEEYRGAGVMYSLYEKGMDWFRSNSVEYVELDIHNLNPKSQGFAERQGFKKYKEFYRMPL